MKTLRTAVTLVMLLVAASCCQAARRNVQYEPPEIESKTPWGAVAYAVVFFAAALVVAFKNPKRTHLD